MRRRTFALAGLLLFGGVVSAAEPVKRTATIGKAPGDFAFVNVTVIPMDREGTLANQTVLVSGGRIQAIGSSERRAVPAGYTVIDGRGKFLIPGLAEMHAHIPGANAPEQLVRDILYLYVANGVTTIRGMLGAPNQLTLREQTRSEERRG